MTKTVTHSTLVSYRTRSRGKLMQCTKNAQITRLFKRANNIQYAEETIPVFDQRFGTWQISVQRLGFSSPELTRLYDEAAPGWCQMLGRLGYPDAYERLLRRLHSEEVLEIVGARPRVLDCGVGTGALSCALAHVLPGPFKLDAIDLSPRMLERASQCFRDTDLDVTLRHGDVRELPYGDGIFDIAMTAHVLEHLADPNVALNEMVRVIKPGGILIACFTRRFYMVKFMITLFFTDFFIRVLINPRFSPSMILGRWLVRNQVPEYVGAAQKKVCLEDRLTVFRCHISTAGYIQRHEYR